MYAELVRGADYRNARLLADTLCAAFVWKKDKSDLGRLCPTERTFRGIEHNPHSINIHVKAEVERLARAYQFFYWHLAFPDVFRLAGDGDTAENEQAGWNGGFDVVLGNPPWDELRPEERKFFGNIAPEVALIENSAKRQKAINALELESPDIWRKWTEHRRLLLGSAQFLHISKVLPRSSRGNLSTATLFMELSSVLIGANAGAGMIVPSGLATNQGTSDLFRHLMDSKLLKSLFDFENRRGYFPSVDSRMRFSLVTLAKRADGQSDARFGFFLTDLTDAADANRVFSLTSDEIARVNPTSHTCPVFRTSSSARLVTSFYRKHPIVSDVSSPDSWDVTTSSMFQMSHEAEELHRIADTLDSPVPLFEGKMIGQFNHRLASIELNLANESRQAQGRASTNAELQSPDFSVRPQYWVKESSVRAKLEDKWSRSWLMHFCAVTSPTNERTCIASLTPLCGAGHSLFQVFAANSAEFNGCLLANLNSFALDFILREKMGGINLSHFIFQQLPVVARTAYAIDASTKHPASVKWILVRVLELTYTAWDLRPFALDCGYDGPSFRWDEERRWLLRCELDAAYFHLYLGSLTEWTADNLELGEIFATPRDAVDYIMETFPIVRRKDEQAHGEYRTKRVIFEIYDEMAEAIRTGQPYLTRLDPPPGPPTDAEGKFIPIAEWDDNNWPPHIHPPRKESEVAL